MRTTIARLGTLFDRRMKLKMLVALIGSMVTAALDSVAIALVLPLIDLATGSGSNSSTIRTLRDLLGHPSLGSLKLILSVAIVVLFVAKDLGSLYFLWWLNGFIYVERVKMSAGILADMLSAPYTRISMRSSAEMMRTADRSVLQVFTYTISGLLYSAASLLSVVAILSVLAVVAPLPTLAISIYFGVAVLLYVKLVRPKARKAGILLSESSLHGFQTAFAALGAIKEVKLRGTQKHFVDNYRDAQLTGVYAGRIVGLIAALPRYLLEILFIIAIGLVVALNSASGTSSGGQVGILALFVAAGFRLLPAISSLLSNASSIGVGTDSLRLVHAEVLAARSDAELSSAEDASQTHGDSILAFSRELELSDVAFRYPTSDTDVLHNVSLRIHRGMSVALVGGSGAGKTTLVDVILGLHEPLRGTIRVDGHDIRSGLRSWQARIGYVEQDVYLLDASLAVNVAFDQSDREIDYALVRASLEQAQLTDVLQAMPDGLQTQVGERGAKLSGGQRQRIGIARALYRRPELLVLDEATSALDNETERKISETISSLRGSVTVVVIAHRLSTVRNVDAIALMNNGRIDAIGSFDDLVRTNEEFARLVALGSLDVSSVTEQ